MNTIIVLFLIVVLIILVLLMVNVFISLVTKDLFNGGYYAETSDKRLQDIFTIAKLKKIDKVLDIGSGDGRIVLAVAKQGIQATGIEINPLLVFISKIKCFFADTETKTNATILCKNLWHFDISKYSIIIIYGIPSMMPELKKKFKKELKPGAKIISVYFPITGWKEKKKLGDIFLYEM